MSSTNTYENNVLQKLLRHQPLTPNEQKELILSDNEELYCFKLHETNKTSCMPKEYMHAALYSFVPQILTSTIYHQHIIGLLKIPKQEGSSRTFFILQRYVGTYELLCRHQQFFFQTGTIG